MHQLLTPNTTPTTPFGLLTACQEKVELLALSPSRAEDRAPATNRIQFNCSNFAQKSEVPGRKPTCIAFSKVEFQNVTQTFEKSDSLVRTNFAFCFGVFSSPKSFFAFLSNVSREPAQTEAYLLCAAVPLQPCLGR
ncbi:hypothetical protein RRG08_056088 [Elysia crispata]|uniref:Uncharacterized protein n=1 Tax=Elysia crispata TaxID=231223 RepID=A0AAE0ZBG5_9GAST|nr:hypothetical protein RRG08_056088 [Elysia crispata]